MMDGGKDTKRVASVGFCEDFVIAILSRLPVKSLMRFKTVCKSWNSIISSTMFVREHLKRAHDARYNQHKNFLGMRDGYCPCVWFKEQDSDEVFMAEELDFPTQNIPGSGDAELRYPWFCNSCDGLICFRMDRVHFVALWNPFVPAEYKLIDTSSFTHYGKYGIGYDPCTDDYKIVSVPYYSVGNVPCTYISFQLYSLKRDSWRTLRITKTRDYEIINTNIIYAKNRLHWLGGEYQYEDPIDVEFPPDKMLFIVYFDFVNESLDYLNLPSTDRLVVPLNYKESLGILCRNPDGDEEEIWVLQDYCGMKSSWAKLFKFSCSYPSPFGCCFLSKGELIVCFENGLAMVDTNDGSSKDVVFEGYDIGNFDEPTYEHIHFTPYVESLVSPIRLQ